MDFQSLLQYAKQYKAEHNSYNGLRDMLEVINEFDESQSLALEILSKQRNISEIIEGINDYQFSIYDNFIDYVDSTIDSEYKLPSFVELDYISMYCRTFRYEDNLYIDWQEYKWCQNKDMYGTDEQRKLYNYWVEHNLQYSTCIEFYA